MADSVDAIAVDDREAEQKYSFDLIHQPWIRVRRKGKTTEVSLEEALIDSDEIDALEPLIATQKPAILRQVLLPVIIDALKYPQSVDDWKKRFTEGAFTPEEKKAISEYLGEHSERFDLFHPDHPFAQAGGLRTTKNETKSSALLVPAMATGNNVPLFSVRTEADELALTPAEAAAWLLHTHCWDTAAIKSGAADDPQAKAGKTTGNPTGPLGQLGVVIPVGRTLYETYLLNIPIREDTPRQKDRPQWERVHAGEWRTRSAEGLLDLFTWQARRIRLIPDFLHGAVVVRRVVVAGGDRLTETPDFEPHTSWRQVSRPKPKEPPYRPRRYTADRAIWRGLDSLIALENGGDQYRASSLLAQVGEARMWGAITDSYPLRVDVFGIEYGNQSAVVENAVVDSLPLPVAALIADSRVRDEMTKTVTKAENLANATNALSADLRRAAGAEPLPWDKGQRPGTVLLHLLDQPTRDLFAQLRRDDLDEDRLVEHLLAWESTASRAVQDTTQPLLDSITPTAFSGRSHDKRSRPAGSVVLRFRKSVADTLRLLVEQRNQRG